MANPVGAVYLHVIDDVVLNMRQQFLNQTGDDSVLDELQSLWELKMMQSGVVTGPVERNSAPSGAGVPAARVDDLNVPYVGTGEYETPTADMFFTPTPSQTPIQTPLAVEPGQYQYFPAGVGTLGGAPGLVADVKTERPAPDMQHQTSSTKRSLDVDVNVAYGETTEEEGTISEPQPLAEEFYAMLSEKRKREEYSSHFVQNGNIPQEDGSADMCLGCSLPQKVSMSKTFLKDAHAKTVNKILKFQPIKKDDVSMASIIKKEHPSQTIPQCDGFSDEYGDVIGSEDYNRPYHDTLTEKDVGILKSPKREIMEDDEPPLNEDDDDDDDDLEDGDGEPIVDNLILAQFDKVSRTKNKWKCQFKDGIMRLNDRDIVFMKAIGEFDF